MRPSTAWLDAEVADAGYPGASVAIVRDGRLERVHVIGQADATGRPVTPDTPFVIGSLSKSLTSLAILRLVDSGAVDLDAPSRDVLPGFRTAAVDGHAAPITIRQALDQTSGLPRPPPTCRSPPAIGGQVRGFAGRGHPSGRPGRAIRVRERQLRSSSARSSRR